MQKKGKGKNGKKGKGAKDEPPPPPAGTIPWSYAAATPQPLRTGTVWSELSSEGTEVRTSGPPARAGNFSLFVHVHTPPTAHVAHVAPISRSAPRAQPERPETVHLLCIANTATGLHIALPLPPSGTARRAAARRQFFVRTPGSSWWVSDDNTPVTVEPPPTSGPGSTDLVGPPVLVPWDARGATPAQGALRTVPIPPPPPPPHDAEDDEDSDSIPAGLAAALPTKQASRGALAVRIEESSNLKPGWYDSTATVAGDELGAWSMCWLGGACGMMEVCLRDPGDDAEWRLTLSANGGASFRQGSAADSPQPPREFTSMPGGEVAMLSLKAVELMSVDCVRSLCRFGAWETVEGVLLDLRALEQSRMAAKQEATAALPVDANGKPTASLPAGWGLSMWLPAADVMHEFLFELLRGEAPHDIVKLAADIAKVAAPHLVDFGPTGDGAPTLDMYLQQLPLPCVSHCGGWSLQTLHDMHGVVYLSLFHASSHVHVALRRDSEGEFDYCLPPGAADSQAEQGGSRTGEDSATPVKSTSRCMGVRASGGRAQATIKPDMRRVRQEAESNFRVHKERGAAGSSSSDDGNGTAATNTLVPLPSARRSMAQTTPAGGGGRGGFAKMLAENVPVYFGNWIVTLDNDDTSFESVVIRHIEHERSAFRLAASVVGSLSFVDSRVPPRTHLLAPPPPWAMAATRRLTTAWVNEW